MVIGSCKIKLKAEWIGSLKEKRTEVKKIVEKTKNKFNVSVAEIGSNDVHEIIEIGLACVTNDGRMANSVIDNTVNFIEKITDAEIIDVDMEIF